MLSYPDATELDELRNAVRRFARAEIAPLARYTSGYDAGRPLRDAKLYEIGGGASEIRRMLIGRELLR